MLDTKRCENCKYRAILQTDIACVYILKTGKRRGCYSGECDKYEEGEAYDEFDNEGPD